MEVEKKKKDSFICENRNTGFSVFLNGTIIYVLSLIFDDHARRFLFNDEVQTSDDVFIFESPEAGSRIAGEKPQSSQGRIIGGPRNADGYVWWFVDYDEDPDGWTAENWLK